MPLIHCKVELKIKWTDHCVLSANGNDNDDANPNSFTSTVKDTKFYVPVVSLSAKDNQNCQIFLVNGLIDQCIGMNIKQKVRIKIRGISIDIFSNQTLQEITDCLFCFIQINMTMQKGIKPEDIIYQKVLLKIIMSSSIQKTSMTNQLILI